MDPLTEHEVRIRISQLSGKILDGFSYFMLAIDHKDMFIEYFKACLTDKL